MCCTQAHVSHMASFYSPMAAYGPKMRGDYYMPGCNSLGAIVNPSQMVKLTGAY